MITKLVDRMIGQEILESEKRDEYICFDNTSRASHYVYLASDGMFMDA